MMVGNGRRGRIANRQRKHCRRHVVERRRRMLRCRQLRGLLLLLLQSLRQLVVKLLLLLLVLMVMRRRRLGMVLGQKVPTRWNMSEMFESCSAAGGIFWNHCGSRNGSRSGGLQVDHGRLDRTAFLFDDCPSYGLRD